jgi:hypothetical protein
MLGAHFYNQAIKKTVVGFGTLFNNLSVVDIDPQDPTNVLGKQKVGLAYAPKEKFLTRLEENPDLTKTSITLPRMYFEMTGISYDPSRKTSPIQKYQTVIADNGDEVRAQFVPVPYNVEFELGILARNQDDGLQLVEQILPYFQPQFNLTINFIPDMGEKKDVAIVLNSIDYSDDWDDNFNQRRFLTWTLRFTVKSYIYGPFNTADIIRKAIIYERQGEIGVADRSTRLTYTPVALTDTTSDPNGPNAGAPDGVIDEFDNAALGPNDDFGFSGEVENFF